MPTWVGQFWSSCDPSCPGYCLDRRQRHRRFRTKRNHRPVPAVREKKAEFAAAFDKFDNDSNDAAAAIKDEPSFKTEWPKVSANCGGCHKVFNVK
jgi:cytochrome c556